MVEANALSSREVILRRVRASLGDRTGMPPPTGPSRPEASPRGPADRRALASCFLERAQDYTATVERVRAPEIGARVAALCAIESVGRLAHPAEIPGEWLPPGVELLAVRRDVDRAALLRMDAALTGCRLAIADTGTVVLDDSRVCGPRALSLIPDLHICVIEEDQLVASVPRALEQIDPRLPTTWVSGPSATSDIELSRVEGVHGPRRLRLLLSVA